MTSPLRSPAVQRWLPLVVIPPILLLDGLLSQRGDPVDALGVLITYLAVLPLAFRERLGFGGLLVPLTAGVVAVLWSYEPGTTIVVLPAWALFELVRHHGRRQATLAAIAVVPCVSVSVLPFADDGAEFVSIVLRNIALCELALAVGYVLWTSRETVEREKAASEADADRRLGEERLRIAREVHDVVAHSMVAINVQAGVAAHLLDADTDQAREALRQIKRTSGDALADLRATLGILRDPGRDAPTAPSAGLADLDGVAAQLRAAGVDVTVDVDTVAAVPTPVHAASYRIVQEALTNVLRHAHATAASVVVRADADALTIVVADDGGAPDGARSGAAATADGAARAGDARTDADGVARAAGAGAGVRGMRERATALGGTLEAGPAAGGGWRVEAVLPLVAAGAPS